MATYMLRNIDPVLWRNVKARCEREGRHLRNLFLGLLHFYVDKGLPDRPPPPTDKRKTA